MVKLHGAQRAITRNNRYQLGEKHQQARAYWLVVGTQKMQAMEFNRLACVFRQGVLHAQHGTGHFVYVVGHWDAS